MVGWCDWMVRNRLATFESDGGPRAGPRLRGCARSSSICMPEPHRGRKNRLADRCGPVWHVYYALAIREHRYRGTDPVAQGPGSR